MDAVSMAKPSRRDVTGKEIYSTSYEPLKMRRAFVFFFFSPSRGQIFGLSVQLKRYAHTVCTAHGVADCTRRCAALRVKSRRWGTTERAPSKAKKNVFGEAHANNLGLKTSIYD